MAAAALSMSQIAESAKPTGDDHGQDYRYHFFPLSRVEAINLSQTVPAAEAASEALVLLTRELTSFG